MNSIDLFKFLMAIVVIAFHTNPFDKCTSVLVNETAIIVADMAVPFFFLASGYFIADKWGDTAAERRAYIQKMIISTFKLYCVWTLFHLPLTIYGYIQSGNSVMECVLSYVKYFLFVGKLYNSYHLWYLLSMLYALAGMWILICRGKGTRHILAAGVFFYVVYLLFRGLQGHNDINGVLNAVGKAYYFVFNTGVIFTGLLYMGIGIYIREHRRLDSRAAAVGIAIGVIIRYTLSPDAGNILSSVMLFALILNLQLPDHPCYFVLRMLSRYIYLVHLLCFSVYTFIIIRRPDKLGVDSFFATLILALAVSVVIIYLKGRYERNKNRNL